MADRYNPLGVQGLIQPQAPRPTPPRFGMSAYEQELNPYYDALMEEEKKKRGWQQPLQWIFDRLQTGQYVSANIAKEIIEAFDRDDSTKPELLKAVYEGLTGETKGSYVDLVREHMTVGKKKVFGGAPEGSRRAQMDWADVLGFVGDVALDPLTWMGFGGAAKASKAAASKFADDAVRITLKQLADEPASIVAKTIGLTDPKAIEQVLAVSTNRGLRKLGNMGDDLGKFIDLTYREAYRTGLHKTQAELIQQTTEGAAGRGLDDIMKVIEAGDAYSGAGKRFTARIGGKELGVSEAGPATRAVTDSWDKFARWFGQENPTTSKFRGAVWGAFNRGPVGEMRRALGFRNPYQKYLRANELEKGLEVSRVASTDSLKDGLFPLQKLSDDEVGQVLDLMARRETAAGMVPAPQTDLFVRSASEIGADPKIAQAADELKATLDVWQKEEAQWAIDLGEDAAKYREWYVPEFFKETSSGGANVRKGRKYTFEQSAQREVDLMQAVWGIDTATAQRMAKQNLTGFSTELRVNVANRALVHGKAKARWSLVEQMKEFGINLSDATDEVGLALQRGGRNIKALGLENVDHKAFEGFVFDADVADIIKRSMDVTGQDMNIFKRGMAKFANWWKGIVTATTGFHARNFMSNTLTQYLRHGVRAFNFDEYMMAVAGVSATIQEGSRKAFLGALNIDESWMAKYLNRKMGNRTIRELAQEARQRGVISEATMGFDPQDIVQKVAGKKGQPLRSTSRAVGNYVENIPRFQSFLIDYSDLAVDPKMLNATGDALEAAIRTADKSKLDWAGREAKKWFIDYSNLTKFEQQTMKSVVPFYSWIRNNLANQISGIALYPDLYSILPKIEELVSYEDPDYDPTLVPQWQRDAGAFPLAKTAEGMFRMFIPDLAHGDLNLIPLQWEEGKLFPKWNGEDLKDELINSTAPWIRRMADMIIASDTPYHFFYKQDLQPTEPAPYLMRLFASRPGVVPVLDGLLKMAGLENGAHLEEDGGKLRIDSRMSIVLQEFLPIIRQLDFAFYLPMTAIPWIEETLQNFTGAKDDYEGAAQVMQMLGYYMGIKTSDADLEKEKAALGRDIYYQSTDALSAARREQPGAEVRSGEAARRRNESIRRLGG